MSHWLSAETITSYFLLRKRSGNKSLLVFRIASHLEDEAQQVLDDAEIPFTRKTKKIVVTVDSQMIETQKEALLKIAILVRRTWEKES